MRRSAVLLALVALVASSMTPSASAARADLARADLARADLARAASAAALHRAANPELPAALQPPDDADDCDRTPDRPCSLAPDAEAAAVLGPDGDVHAYRFFALAAGAHVRLELADAPAGTRLRLLGWGARPLAEATVSEAMVSEARPARVEAEPRAAGAYLVGVVGPDQPPDQPPAQPPDQPYRLSLDLRHLGPTPRVVTLVPPTAESSAPGGAAEGRYTLPTARGGSPDAGLALARGLRTSPETDLADFELVADVQVEGADGPAAATVRFRYLPEAGGGTGYLVSVDPFVGEVAVSTFDEGRRTPLVAPVMHPLAKAERGPLRLGIRAVGPSIAVSIDGQEIVGVTDDRFASGQVALGVVTWSGPVVATFDNVLVTIPSP